MLSELGGMAQDSIDVLPRRRWWLVPLLITAAIALLGAGMFMAYRKTEPDRLCKKARSYLDAGDYSNAAMALQRAVMLSPKHEKAARMMVELAERIGSPSAIAWKEHVVELNPDSNADRESWTASAIRMRNMDAAESALSGAPEAFRSTPSYEALRGMIAIGKGKWMEAEAAFGEACRRDPANTSYQLNHAIAQVQNPDSKMREEGRNTLLALARGSDHATGAKRALIPLFARQKKTAEAARLSAEVASAPEATMRDHLVELDLVQSRDALPEALDRAQKAASSPEDLSALLRWLTFRGMAADARLWAESLQPGRLEAPKVIESFAEVLAATNDWQKLAEWTAPRRPWAGGDGMRCAFEALAADKSGNGEAASNYWQLAVRAAAESHDHAMNLAYFAQRAGWRARMMDVLWAASASPDGEWALRMLHPLCVEDGNTSGLLRIAKRLLEIRPGDDRARNNVIQLSLLLNEPPAPFVDAARQLHAKVPGDAVFASTLAYALHANGATDEGLQVLSRLPAGELARPEIATYYAALLSAAGRDADARAAAEIAWKGKLLPEEVAMLKNIPK